MRILQIASCFYPAWAYGGPVPVAYNLSKELVKRGHEVVVYATDTIDRSTRQKARYLEIGGVKIYYFRNISNSLAWRRLFFAPSMILRLKKEVKNFDIMHLQDYRTFQNIIGYYYAKKYSIPYVLQAHGSVVTLFGKGNLKKVFDAIWGYRILRDASKLIALTPMEVEQYKSMAIKEDKIEIVPNGIDLSEFKNLPERGEFRRKYGLDNNQKIILYLGRIYKPKGLDLLVKAFDDLIRRLSDVRLIIAGPDDGYLTELRRLVKELPAKEKVLFTGPLYERDKLKAYVDADVYVLPSVYETFPVTVLEAWACGTPVIVTDRCGIAGIVDKVGYVVEYDKDQLRDVIFKVLSDEGLRRRFGEKGKRLVGEEFGWDKIITQLDRIYRDIVT